MLEKLNDSQISRPHKHLRVGKDPWHLHRNRNPALSSLLFKNSMASFIYKIPLNFCVKIDGSVNFMLWGSCLTSAGFRNPTSDLPIVPLHPRELEIASWRTQA